MAQFINKEDFKKTLFNTLNKHMLEAAEPVINTALKEVKKRMRKELAASLISLIESNVSLENFGTDLRVTIRRFKD